MKQRLLSALLALALMLALAPGAAAKTTNAAKADNIFVYAADQNGDAVLLKVLPLNALQALAHGQGGGRNYYYSSTDNYPTTQYCEAQGITIPELLEHVKSVSGAAGVKNLTFAGGDKLSFMATDSYGSYTRSWTAASLYGEKRYYFEKLYDGASGWKTGWEIASEDDSKFGLGLDKYNSEYKSGDKYYADKRAVFAAGVEMPVLLATRSLSGRTGAETLAASTEPGLAGYIARNGGVAAGSLANALTDETALRLCLPMTEADLMAAHRTAYDNFKWIYNLRLTPEKASPVTSKGTVAAPTASFAVQGNALRITMSCATPGASVYYSFDGAPQIPYTGAVSYDIAGRDLNANPVTVYMTAVKEGYADAGVVSARHPEGGVSFQSLYTAMLGEDLRFDAAENVTAQAWSRWTAAVSGVGLKAPGAAGYTALGKGDYSFGDRALTLHKALFRAAGAYSFVVYAAGYANKTLSVSMKRAAPEIRTEAGYALGGPVTLRFDDGEYQKGISVYVSAAGGRSMIPAAYLDRSQAGALTIRADYFALPSAVITAGGSYTLELANSAYAPASRTVRITVTGEGAATGEIAEEPSGTGSVYNLVLSVTGDARTSITAAWQDTENRPELMQVVSAADYAASGFQKAVNVQAAGRDISLDGSGVWHYEATATGLRPGTEYAYRVGCAGAWSEVHTFTTDSGGDSVSFAFLGDAQTAGNMAEDYAEWGSLLRGMRERNPDLSFAVLGGDMVNSGISQPQFDALLSNASPVFSNIPLLAANGNHESNFPSGKPELMLDIFALPRNGPAGYEEEFYSLDVGNVHLLVLNSWVFSGEQKNADMEAINSWIKADLSASKADWQVVVTHLPAYAVASDATANKVRESWAPIFEQYGVDLVFVGHQHVYARSYPMYEGSIDYENGIPYIMGVSGAKFYGTADETLSEKTVYNTAAYQLVRTAGGSLTVQTVDAAGNELDSVAVRQRQVKAAQAGETAPLPVGGAEEIDGLAAETLSVYVGYYGGPYYEKAVFTLDELRAMPQTAADYTFIDAMPAAVINNAAGVTLASLMDAAGIDLGSIQYFTFQSADVYHETTQFSKTSLIDTPRYCFYSLPEHFGEDGVLEGAGEAYAPVETLIALRDNFRRGFEGAGFGLPAVNERTRFRLVFGQSHVREARASESIKWIYRINVTLGGAPTETTEESVLDGEVGSVLRTEGGPSDGAVRVKYTPVALSESTEGGVQNWRRDEMSEDATALGEILENSAAGKIVAAAALILLLGSGCGYAALFYADIRKKEKLL